MSTVRIYKVAELLNTTSQEVMALLKRDHGIEVKSASSTIEEVVARQFVERLARQRSIQLPPIAGMFVEAPAPAKGGKKPTRAPEPPPKPTPTLGPPRLVKTITRPADAPGAVSPAAAAAHEAFEHLAEPVAPAAHTAAPSQMADARGSATSVLEPPVDFEPEDERPEPQPERAAPAASAPADAVVEAVY